MTVKVQLQPYDEHNQTLESYVCPPDRVNPEPADRYNLVVIGAGPAGLITAIGAAGLGAKVALIERELMGGDCLNVGCVPSKSLIAAARAAALVRNAGDSGVDTQDTGSVNFPAVMERMRRVRAHLARHDSVERIQELGIDVFLGNGRFTGDGCVDVSGKKLSFRKAAICTGAKAAALPIPGLEEVEYLTNESIFSLTELPQRLIVIGGGPIGSELAQSFARFGSRVTQIEKESHILSREDSEAARIVQTAMERDGVEFQLDASAVRVERRGDDRIVVIEQNGEQREVIGDQLLVGTGRAPNVEGFGLENVGVRFDSRYGIEVNDRLQTTNPAIYAAGDVCSQFRFTHAADAMARIVIQNALFMGRGKVSSLTIPWTTYTSPELAHVGMHADEAKSRGIPIDTFTQLMDGVDRAVVEGESDGFVRVHVRKGTDEILGATIVASNAGDMISEITLAMTHGLGLKQIASTIHPYPTQADAIRKVGDLYNRTRLTPWISRLLHRWLAWTR